jgi:hypothetical protein
MHDRTPMERMASLVIAGGAARQVRLLDLSEGGAGIEMDPREVRIGQEGRLAIDGVQVPVRVVGAADGRVGLSFAAAGPQALDHVRRLLGPRARAA